jgi:hypothetical protein
LATDLSYALADNYPNRFNPTTKINNQVLGYKVTTLVNEQTWAGICTQKWNAVNRSSEVNYFDYKLKVLLKTEKNSANKREFAKQHFTLPLHALKKERIFLCEITFLFFLF